MQQVLTIKVRLKPNNKQAQQFINVSNIYQQACNIVSQWYFDNYFGVARKEFNRDMYYKLKETFPKLNSAMIQSTYRTVKLVAKMNGKSAAINKTWFKDHGKE